MIDFEHDVAPRDGHYDCAARRPRYISEIELAALLLSAVPITGVQLSEGL